MTTLPSSPPSSMSSASPSASIGNPKCCMAELLDLQAYSKYLIVIQAVNNHGAGPTSPEVLATTLEDGNITVHNICQILRFIT